MTPGDTFVCVHSNRKQGSSKRNTFSIQKFRLGAALYAATLAIYASPLISWET